MCHNGNKEWEIGEKRRHQAPEYNWNKKFRPNEMYRYLGMDESDGIKNLQMKEKVKKEYYRRVRQILGTQLSSKYKITSINSLAIPVMMYIFGVLDWLRPEIQQLDRKTRKKLTMEAIHHPRADVDRLHVKRRNRGRGLLELEAFYDQTMVGLADYLEKEYGNLMKIVKMKWGACESSDCWLHNNGSNRISQKHNKVASYIYWTACRAFGIEVVGKYYRHEPVSVINTDAVTIMWDSPVVTDRTITVNRPDLVIHNKKKKTCLLIDVSVPDDGNVMMKEAEKILKYKDLEIDVNRMWNVKTMSVPIIIDALETLKKDSAKNTELISGKPGWVKCKRSLLWEQRTYTESRFLCYLFYDRIYWETRRFRLEDRLYLKQGTFDTKRLRRPLIRFS